MKKTFTTTKKMMQYATSAAAFLSLNQAGAAVVYTDLDPDQVIGGEGAEFALDLNSDGTDDFNFSIYSFSGAGTYYGISFTYGVKVAFASALNGNEFMGEIVTYSGYSGVYAPVLAAGEGINSEDSFADGAASLALSVQISVLGFPYYSYVAGNWLDTDNAFMGVRLNIDKDRYYGWIRLSVSDDAGTITIHDYAYQSTANEAIFTGQTATDIQNPGITGASIFAYGSQLTIGLPEDIAEAQATVYDLSGKMVIDLGTLSGTRTIACSDLASGNYIVRLQNDMGTYNKQVHLSN